jgi:hypothetical protein
MGTPLHSLMYKRSKNTFSAAQKGVFTGVLRKASTFFSWFCVVFGARFVVFLWFLKALFSIPQEEL